MARWLTGALAIAATATAARAEPVPAGPSAAEPTAPPVFSSLDRTAGATGGGADLGFQTFDDSNSDGGNVSGHGARMDVFFEYAATSAFGVTASLPLVWTDVHVDDIAGLGSIYLAGYGRLRLADDHELVLRGGVQLPTDTYVPEGTYVDDVVPRATAFQRLQDPPIAGGAVWFRGGASYRFRQGPLALQLNYVTDLPAGLDVDVDGYPMRVTVAGGAAYAPGRFSLAGEVVASGHPYVELPDDCYAMNEVFEATYCEQVSTVATVTGRWNADPLSWSLWLSKPLDEALRDHDVLVVGLGRDELILSRPRTR